MAMKMQHMRKVYTYEDGSTGQSAKPGWTKLTFNLYGSEKDENDKPIVVDSFDVSKADLPDAIKDCAIGHGVSQKMGDDQAGIATKAKAENVEPDPKTGYAGFIKGRLSDMMDNFANGVWVAEGEGSSGGGNVTILFEAIVSAFGDAGQELTDEQKATVRAKLQDEDYRKSARARPDVGMHVARITAERAAERAKAARKAAKDAGTSDMGDLLSA